MRLSKYIGEEKIID